MGAQTGLVSLLDRHQIPFVIIKGAAAAMAYPDPYLRAAGDVDFLVRRCDYEKTAALLEESGFELNHEKLSWMHHYGYKYRKVSFELHSRLGSIKQSDDRLISLFEEGIMNSERKEIGSFSFPVLPEDLNGLSLLFHINQHLRTGLGLRQIIDWMMYIDRLPTDVWDNQVLPLLRQTGMEKLALTVTAMCQRYLGLRKIVEESESYPCRELMDYILEKGNFGRKSGKYGKISSVSLVSSSPVRFWKRLQKGGTLIAIGGEAFSGIVRSNKTAAFIVDQLKTETTEEQIIDAMCAKYDAPRETIAADVREILDTMRRINAIDE